MTLRSAVVRGVAWSSVEQWGREASTFLVFIVLSRLLGPEAFGLVALANVFILVGSYFVDFGFRSAIVQRQEADASVLDSAFWTNMAVGTLLAGTALVTAHPVAHLIGEPGLAPLLQVLSVRFLIGGLSTVPEALLTRNMAFRALAVRTHVATLGGGITGMTMALMGFGVWSLVAQALVTPALAAVGLWWATPWRPGGRFALGHACSLVSFGWRIVGFNVLGQINQQAQPLLIGSLLGTTALGYYVIGLRILHMLLQLLSNVSTRVALPTFARLQRQRERLADGLYTAVRWTALLTFPAFVGLAFVASHGVPVALGEAWAPSVPVIRVLAGLGVLQSIFYFNATVLVATGRPGARLAQLLVHSLLNVGLFLLVYPLGLMAIAGAYTVRAYLLAPFDFWLVRTSVPIDVRSYVAHLAPAMGATATMALVLASASLLFGPLQPTPLTLFGYVFVGVAGYAVGILLWAPHLARQALYAVRSALRRTARAAP